MSNYKIEMLPSTEFFIEEPELREGGIVVCGLNFGTGGGEPEIWDENENFIGKTKTFLEPPASGANDPYRKKIIQWFRAWGYDLKPYSELDAAIIPTNLFYTFTRGCHKGDYFKETRYS